MKKFPVIAAAAAAAVLTVGTVEMHKYCFYRGNSKLAMYFLDGKSHEDDYYEHRDSTAEQFRHCPVENYTIKSDRGEALKGFYYTCGDKPSGRIAFIIHGHRSEHAETAGMYYQYYMSRGFDVFCCDHTAHGMSEGEYIGFDVFESADCLKWIDFLVERFGSSVQIILHGFSMGGATVLKMSDRCPDNVKFIISDSPFMSGERLLAKRMGPLIVPVELLNLALAKYRLSDSDVRPNLDRSKLPILFVHGREDKMVPFENGETLYNCYNGEKDCLFTDDSRHIETMHRYPAEYQARIDSFIEKYVK